MKSQPIFIFFISIGIFIKLLGLHYFFSYSIHEVLYKNSQIRLERESTPLLVMTFSLLEQKNLSWEEQDEFERNGKKYDVQKTEVLPNGDLKVYCYQDNLETSLQNFLEEDDEPSEGKDKPKKSMNDEYLPFGRLPSQAFSLSRSTHFSCRHITFFPLFEASLPLIPPESV